MRRGAPLAALVLTGALAGCALTETLGEGGRPTARRLSLGPLVLPRPAGDLAVTWVAAGLVVGPLPEAKLGLAHGAAVYGACARITDGRPMPDVAIPLQSEPMEDIP